MQQFETCNKPILANLLTHKILAEHVEKGKSIPFCPYTKRLSFNKIIIIAMTA